MKDLIDRQAAMALAKDNYVFIKDGTVYKHRCIDPDAIRDLPPAQPNYDKQRLINSIRTGIVATNTKDVYSCGMRNGMRWCKSLLEDKPPTFEDSSQYAQPDIIRCNACKHWTQTTGNMPGFGLGDCDYLNAKFVNCNGYCYWAERRQDG